MSVKIDKIIRSKRKTIALVITPQAELIVRTPIRTSEEYIHWIVDKKQKWILEKQDAIRKTRIIHNRKEFVEGESFLYIGGYYQLKFVIGCDEICISNDSIIIPSRYMADAENKLIGWYKKEALRILQERVGWYASRFGYKYCSIKTTKARKRWGSCSSKNSLNFTWRLIMAPLPVIDYIVLHELVHTQVKNHSGDFWKKVKTTMPDYKKHQNWLKSNLFILSSF